MPAAANAKAESAETWTRAKASLLVFAISIGISLFTAAYEKAVDPLFGSFATIKYMNYVVYGSTALGIILPKPPRSLLLPVLATLVQIASHSCYWVSVFAARNGDPVLGPLVTHVTVLAPVIYLAVSLATSIDSMLATLALAANALQLRPLILLVARYLSLDTQKDVLFLILGSLTSLFYTMENIRAFRPSRGTFLSNAIVITRKFWAMSIPAAFLLFPTLRSPTLSGSGVYPYQSRDYPLRILFSKDSVTGVIVVGELPPPEEGLTDPTALHSIRYLRASHSLLGGVWIGSSNVVPLDGVTFKTDQAGAPLGNSIYSTFVLQEAVRLVNNNPHGGTTQRENALVIGLGAGISADALLRHGISTTIVEIDPAVYEAARKYFGLEYPGDDHVFLEDARNWVYKRSITMQAGDKKNPPTFDIVIHDCFSGGGVPQHLFSVEFWNDLKSIMSPDGVVAVNFAGKFGSHSTRAIVTTLLRVFRQCRVFHDSPTPIPEDQLLSEFLNMVFFCSPSSSPLTFRPSVDADYLHSYLRLYLLSNLDEREVPISQLKGKAVWSKDTEENFVLADMNNTLNAWQSEEALDHWKTRINTLEFDGSEYFWGWILVCMMYATFGMLIAHELHGFVQILWSGAVEDPDEFYRDGHAGASELARSSNRGVTTA